MRTSAGRDPSGRFEITRRFEAPLERVWAAWSHAEQMRKWWGPKGCAIDLVAFDFRPGGFFHYAMRFPGEEPMWGRFLFREIAAPRRLVWLNSFSNESCGIERAPFSELCPLEVENVVTMHASSGGTTVHLTALPFGAGEAERRWFDELGPSLGEGYGGTFDALATHLTRG